MHFALSALCHLKPAHPQIWTNLSKLHHSASRTSMIQQMSHGGELLQNSGGFGKFTKITKLLFPEPGQTGEALTCGLFDWQVITLCMCVCVYMCLRVTGRMLLLGSQRQSVAMWKDWFEQIHTLKSFADAINSVYFQNKIQNEEKLPIF